VQTIGQLEGSCELGVQVIGDDFGASRRSPFTFISDEEADHRIRLRKDVHIRQVLALHVQL